MAALYLAILVMAGFLFITTAPIPIMLPGGSGVR